MTSHFWCRGKLFCRLIKCLAPLEKISISAAEPTKNKLPEDNHVGASMHSELPNEETGLYAASRKENPVILRLET